MTPDEREWGLGAASEQGLVQTAVPPKDPAGTALTSICEIRVPLASLVGYDENLKKATAKHDAVSNMARRRYMGRRRLPELLALLT